MPDPASSETAAARSRVVRRGEDGWEGLAPLAYRRGDAPPAPGVRDPVRDPVQRWLLAGGPASGSTYELRYFELAPGARTAHERHQHEHAVVVLAGEGEVLLDGEVHAVAPGDLVRVAPGGAHQFRNAGSRPFGFLCVVDSERDRPVPIDGDDGPSCSLGPE
jgi:S-methyl-1-thioxylulose 5-phosphate methylthiotransferase